MSLVQHGHAALPEPDAPGLFSMASEEHTRTLLHEAGFADVRTEYLPVTFPVPDVDAEMESTLERFVGDSGYQVPGLALCAAPS